MDKQKFKAAFSKYREILSGRYERRITEMGVDLNEVYVNAFNKRFGFEKDILAFSSAGSCYSFPFEWVYGQRGSFRAERIIERNKHLIGW